jgi:hypothetical protein
MLQVQPIEPAHEREIRRRDRHGFVVEARATHLASVPRGAAARPYAAAGGLRSGSPAR